MNVILIAVLTGLAVGAGGTGGGAALTFLFRKAGRKLSAVLMGLSGGIMLAAVVDMVPHASESAGALPVVIGAVVGALAMYFVTRLIPHQDADDLSEETIRTIKSKGLQRSGMLLAVGIAIHNLPQGIAIGSGITTGIGTTLALLMLLHNIPEGMAMAIPLKLGGVSKGRILGIALIAALPTAVGSLIGAAIAGISETFIGAAVAFAGGSMLYLTIRELIPQAFGMHKSAWTLVALVAGLALGVVVIWTTHAH